MLSEPGMKDWKKTGFIATIVIVLAFPVYLGRVLYQRSRPAEDSGPFYTGRVSCIECHKKEDDLWLDSHHDLAMDTASATTVLGNFDNLSVRAER